MDRKRPLAMKQDDDDLPRRPPIHHELGQPLADLSIAELEDRIVELRAEISRLEAARDSKRAANAAADAFFRK
jgi:uncharacterized small protein (DUF1192 family)